MSDNVSPRARTVEQHLGWCEVNFEASCAAGEVALARLAMAHHRGRDRNEINFEVIGTPAAA